ncbi:siderophore-interacting protein [Actinophytocola xanthii]|uniref:NADPH-dependent ferric siderophore reductase n=1 Tax=Actinophytocola xanthii TaxID=1912961 RepID=A0A1Q8CC22_9PSEU|nr:siderophore-interacting protein [Actinophytocola xanthii]OLF11898.1 NADPH-dependent ferric siderophore reductase [Actinophytocola xanthii]
MEAVGLLEVTAVRRVTPRLVRVSFRAPEGFTAWPDQQLKLLFPREGQTKPRLPPADDDQMRWYTAFLAIPEAERPVMRSFTVRGHDPGRGEIDVDFVLHGDHGPAARWAAAVEPGQVLGRYGPSEVYRRPLPAASRYLFAGDETALAAIASLLASLPAGASAEVVVEVASAAEEQGLTSPARITSHWLHRDGRPPGGDLLLSAVTALEVPPTAVAWLAGEAAVVRALRRHLVGRGVPKARIEFAGYWRRGLTEDDPPTPEDLAQAQERLAQSDG